MSGWQSRTIGLIGGENARRLSESKIALFGLGGVGSFVLEALVRAGIGSFTLVDYDAITESNLNRQLLATVKTIGQKKAQAAKNRALEINPAVKIRALELFVTPENIDEAVSSGDSYVVDAVDNVTAKIAIIKTAKKLGIPVISSMGTGNKTDPSKLFIGELSRTSVCPLARVMRRELRKRDILDLTVLSSTEPPVKPVFKDEPQTDPRTPASVSFVPSAAGILIAAKVVRDLIGLK